MTFELIGRREIQLEKQNFLRSFRNPAGRCALFLPSHFSEKAEELLKMPEILRQRWSIYIDGEVHRDEAVKAISLSGFFSARSDGGSAYLFLIRRGSDLHGNSECIDGPIFADELR